MTGMEAMERYLLNLKSYNKRDGKTIAAYRSDIKEGVKYLFGSDDFTFEELNKLDYMDIQERWFIPRQNEGIKAATINRKKISFEGFCNSLVATKMIDANPCSYIRKVVDDAPFEKKVLSEEETIKLLKVSNERYKKENDYESARDNLIINILASTGMRAFELEMMDIDDIAFSNGGFDCLCKRGGTRKVVLNEYVLRLYRDYLYHRNQITGKVDKKNSSKALILSLQYKTRLTTRSIERIVDKMTKLAGLPKITPHSFKHRFITSMNEQGITLEAIGKFTGNKSSQTMYKHYLHQGEDDSLKELANSNPIYKELV